MKMNPAFNQASSLLRHSGRPIPWAPTGWFVAGLFFVAALSSCRKSQPTPSATEPKPIAKKTVKPASSASDLENVLQEVNNDVVKEEAALEAHASAIMDAHPEMSAQELLNVPEVNVKLADFLKELSKSLELQARVNDSIAFAATMKNLQGSKENWKFAMDLSGYDKARTHRLITSIISGKPERVINFFEHEVTEASAEFTLDPAAPKSSNGITLEKKPALEPPK